ncbi:MAG: (2Fe-2S)-binding protein, partial [Deltaproteobacteria bacterium]|nr:(2Fe-2S)-binding protein [Deltaproteobacteria bacterium]
MAIQLDGERVAATAGETVLQVARRAGRSIPTLCHVDGLDTPDSCLLCVVEVGGHLVPSCSLKVQPDLVVATHGPRIQHARQAAMQLLLSEHQGECRAPCELACPAGWDIAEFEQTLPKQPLLAARMALDGLGLPTTLGQVCDAPCHRACRRGELDRYLDIRRTHAQLPLGDLELPPPPQGPAVVVVGGGPTGLAAAHRLVQLGYRPIIFEREAELGGSLLPL